MQKFCRVKFRLLAGYIDKTAAGNGAIKPFIIRYLTLRNKLTDYKSNANQGNLRLGTVIKSLYRFCRKRPDNFYIKSKFFRLMGRNEDLGAVAISLYQKVW